MSRHVSTTAGAFALALTATILASSAAQAFGTPQCCGQYQIQTMTSDADGHVKNTQPGLGFQATQGSQGRILLPTTTRPRR